MNDVLVIIITIPFFVIWLVGFYYTFKNFAKGINYIKRYKLSVKIIQK